MGWLIAGLILLGLAWLPLGVRCRYDTDGFGAWLLIGPMRFRLYPRRKRTKKQEEKPKENKISAPKKSGKDTKQKQGGSLKDFLPLLQLAKKFLSDLRRKLRVSRLEMKLIMAGDDPCDLAVNYGRAWAAVGNILPQLERLFVIKKRKIDVDCDFLGEETTIFLRMDMTLTVFRILTLAVPYGVRALREYLKYNDKKKGGAVK